jgi:hypothetical protein
MFSLQRPDISMPEPAKRLERIRSTLRWAIGRPAARQCFAQSMSVRHLLVAQD